MFNFKIKKLPKNTLETIIDIPKVEVEKEYAHAFEHLSQELTIEGFRKGKAPKSVAEKHIQKETIYQSVIRTLLPKAYEEVVKKENLVPVTSPKIELLKAKENEDWQVKMTIALKPEVDLGDYKKDIQEAKAKAKKADIWVPGKDQKPQENKEMADQKVLNEVLTSLLKTAKVEISDLIVEEEVNRRLTQQVDEIQKIGLTVDAYLKSKNLTMEQLKAGFTKEITDTYKLEFILQAVADKEGIKVEEADLEKLFANIKEEKDRQMAKQNAYFYASILRKQKTLDFLISL